MTKRPPANRPCHLRVTVHHPTGLRSDQRWVTDHDVRGRPLRLTRYRSIRQARRNIRDAAQHMDRLSRATYSIDIMPIDGGGPIPVSQAVVDHVDGWNRYWSWYYSIGARLARGEAVAV